MVVEYDNTVFMFEKSEVANALVKIMWNAPPS